MRENPVVDSRGEGLGIYDPVFVKGVFDRCSRRYIAFSWMCSFGFTERWRRQCTKALELAPAQAATGYDLMAGTGEVWPHLLAVYPQIQSITAVDISTGMHERAIARLHRHRAHKIDFIEDDALKSRLPPGSADFIVSTFGLKTFNSAQHRQLATLIARTLKPGGRFSLIEASDPKGWFLRPLYLFYLYRVLPLVERFLLRGAQDFSMIGQYCDRFGDAEAFARMLREEGLAVQYRRYIFGCATGVSGQRAAK
ncbi:MAG TPA: class I SAM-dependent methyltransferase [Rhodopila sp.]|nr:class I SAM-dependent methyltransferase [Rhodopila sp.]